MAPGHSCRKRSSKATTCRNRRRTNQVCSAFQIAEFDCDIQDDVVGVYVCRGGATTCVLATDTLTTDTCGCCPGDTRVECLNDGDGWVGVGDDGTDDGDNDDM